MRISAPYYIYNSAVRVYLIELLPKGWTYFDNIFYVFEWVPGWYTFTIRTSRQRCDRAQVRHWRDENEHPPFLFLWCGAKFNIYLINIS